MPKRRTLYDKTIDRLKNNKVIAAFLIFFAVVMGLLSLVEIGEKVHTNWPHKAPHGSAVAFSRVVLSPSQYWETLRREEPNYFYEEALSGEADRKFLELIAREKKEGKYDCPYMFASPTWCRKSAAFFSQKGLQNIAIDPKFDILITNKRANAVVFHSIGVEISYAAMVTVSLGEWVTTKVKVDGQYDIPMPRPPTAVIVNNKVVDWAQQLKESGESELWTEDTIDSRAVQSILQGDFEWSNLPLTVWAPPGDPVYLPPGAPYRFEVVLKDYKRMPNNVVLRFVAHTNYDDVTSDYFYLLAM